MAGPNPSQSTSMQSDGSKLDKHLEEAYNMPPSQWWDSVRQAFVQLQYLSRSRSGVAEDPDIDQPADEYAVSARLARAASLPAIVLLPSGNHALGLTATNEALQCVAFGTAGRKMFVELLWEAIAQAQNNGTAKVVVHEVLQGEIPQITLRVESHLFELRYFQCEPLVRTYPNILDAPVSFLEDRNSCSVALQQEVAKLQQGHRLDKKFNTNPDYRRAYYYKRAWAIAWGLFDSDKDAQHVFELCDNTSLDCNEDFSSIISKFVQLWGLHYPQVLKYRTNHWHQLLSQIEVEPLHRKLDYPYYLQVTVLYTGPSGMMGGEWLSMVESRLEWLKTNLNALVLTPRQAFGSGQRFRIWPQRLVRRHATPGDGVYEGCFLLGLDIEKSLLSTVMQVVERWKLGIIDDDLTSKGQCFLDVIMIHDKSELEKLDLKTCTRNWPRPIMKSEEGSRESHSLTLSKRERRELSREQRSHGDATVEVSKSTNKLRPASDVLNRLRYGGEYDIDEFVVGYKDRHSSRLMEKPAVQWARDTTDEEFIPEHRIEYFKRYNQQGEEEIFWDKSARLDKIFQHRGSG